MTVIVTKEQHRVAERRKTRIVMLLFASAGVLLCSAIVSASGHEVAGRVVLGLAVVISFAAFWAGTRKTAPVERPRESTNRSPAQQAKLARRAKRHSG
jgi:hypothetical protein